MGVRTCECLFAAWHSTSATWLGLLLTPGRARRRGGRAERAKGIGEVARLGRQEIDAFALQLASQHFAEAGETGLCGRVRRVERGPDQRDVSRYVHHGRVAARRPHGEHGARQEDRREEIDLDQCPDIERRGAIGPSLGGHVRDHVRVAHDELTVG